MSIKKEALSIQTKIFFFENLQKNQQKIPALSAKKKATMMWNKKHYGNNETTAKLEAKTSVIKNKEEKIVAKLNELFQQDHAVFKGLATIL